MAWISVHESVKGTKLRDLGKEMDTTEEEALGALVKLWIWGLENAEKSGEIRNGCKEDILEAFSLKFLKKHGFESIVDKLIKTGWIDEDLAEVLNIHDWEVWQEQWYKAKDKREADTRRKREIRRNKAPAPKPEEPQEKQDVPQDCPSDSPQESTRGTPPDVVPTPPSALEPPKYTTVFEDFWESYPRKIGKGEAYKKYKARRNDGYSDDELLRAAKNYANQCKRLGTQKDYIKHPKTFLSENLPFLDFLPKREQPQSSEQLPDTSNPFAEYREES